MEKIISGSTKIIRRFCERVTLREDMRKHMLDAGSNTEVETDYLQRRVKSIEKSNGKTINFVDHEADEVDEAMSNIEDNSEEN